MNCIGRWPRGCGAWYSKICLRNLCRLSSERYIHLNGFMKCSSDSDPRMARMAIEFFSGDGAGGGRGEVGELYCET